MRCVAVSVSALKSSTWSERRRNCAHHFGQLSCRATIAKRDCGSFALYLDDLSRLCLSGCTIILYADDVLFISPSICRLEKLLHCKKELHWLDMAINFKKSCCMRIGPRCDTHCMNL